MATKLQVRAILMDIEGTVCPISFVKDVLFPYALSALPKVLEESWTARSFLPYRDAFPSEHSGSPSALLAHVQDLTTRDLKIPALKALQGYLWRQGYTEGQLACPLFADVEPAMRAWHGHGAALLIYSSGSVDAQKLLFQYTESASSNAAAAAAAASDEVSAPTTDLRPLITDYFDTVNAGPKMAPASYKRIIAAHPTLGGPHAWLFLSDNVREVEAARGAGMQALVVDRPGNAPLDDADRLAQRVVRSFEELEVEVGV